MSGISDRLRALVEQARTITADDPQFSKRRALLAGAAAAAFAAAAPKRVEAAYVPNVAQVFPTVAALKAAPVPAQIGNIQTLGYYAPGDGGGGFFRWDGSSSATDNGGSIIQPTSVSGNGRWLVIGNEYALRLFGGKSDGSTNDTTKAVAWFAAMIADQKSGYMDGNTVLDPGQLLWQVTDGSTNPNGTPKNASGPIIHTGLMTTITVTDAADASVLTIQKPTLTGGEDSDFCFVTGGYIGPLNWQDSNNDSSPNRHCITLSGVQEMLFDAQVFQGIRGDCIHILARTLAGNGDPYQVASCSFNALLSQHNVGDTATGYALNNDADNQTFNGNQIGSITQQIGGGAWRGAGAANTCLFISCEGCLSWAVDFLNASGTTTRCQIGGMELDSPQFALRVQAAIGYDLGTLRINYRRNFWPQQPADTTWPTQPISIGGGGASVLELSAQVIHRPSPEVLTAFWPNPVVNYNSDSAIGSVRLNHRIILNNVNQTMPIALLNGNIGSSVAGLYTVCNGQVIYNSNLNNFASADLALTTITNAADNGSGFVRLTVASSGGFVSTVSYFVSGVTGTTEANGLHAVTVVNGTTIDLTTVAFVNAYVSGGQIAASVPNSGYQTASSKLQFSRVLVDSCLNFDVVNQWYTAPYTGQYEITAGFQLTTAAATLVRLAVMLTRGASVSIVLEDTAHIVSAASPETFKITPRRAAFNAGDKIWISANQNATANVAISGGNSLSSSSWFQVIPVPTS